MSTYKFRHKFLLSHKGLLKGEIGELDFTLPNGYQAQLKSIDANTFNDSTKFEVLSGGYPTEEEALKYGNGFKESILCFGAKYRVGVDVGKERRGPEFSELIKEKIFEEQGFRLINDVHGVSVFSEEHPTTWMSVSMTGLTTPKEANFFKDEICKIMSTPRDIDEKIRLSMELLTSSYFESSPRSRFLTLVLAAESILNLEDRAEKSKNLVDELKRLTKLSCICEEDKKSMIGSLEWLYKDSISQGLKKMAKAYLPGKIYNNADSEKFIKKCYDARSKLVHSGGVDESKYKIEELAANLEVYMTDMLVTLSGI